VDSSPERTTGANPGAGALFTLLRSLSGVEGEGARGIDWQVGGSGLRGRGPPVRGTPRARLAPGTNPGVCVHVDLEVEDQPAGVGEREAAALGSAFLPGVQQDGVDAEDPLPVQGDSLD
jgi:hypothetical protein